MTNKRKLLCSLFLCIFFIITILLLSNNISFFDDHVYSFIISIKSNSITKIFKALTFLCSEWFIICATILLVIFVKRKKNKLYIVGNLTGCVILNQVLKHIIRRARPVGINLIKENGFSYPSGHSMVSLAFYGFLIYLIIKADWNKKIKLLLVIVLSIIILLIGISRIYLGVHYPSDVLSGFSLSLTYLLLSIYLYEKIGD